MTAGARVLVGVEVGAGVSAGIGTGVLAGIGTGVSVGDTTGQALGVASAGAAWLALVLTMVPISENSSSVRQNAFTVLLEACCGLTEPGSCRSCESCSILHAPTPALSEQGKYD